MLYTVIPLERVYVDHSNSAKSNVTDSIKEEEYKDIMLKHGRLIVKRSGDAYVVEKINSTDMKDYLNDEYVPGKTIRE
ncbi:MAG: hypothetical protein K0S47_1355 [Herbinix sp.]|jgi:hypothetical protein|nr:hypothetical protein [Herbinix sp.]